MFARNPSRGDRPIKRWIDVLCIGGERASVRSRPDVLRRKLRQPRCKRGGVALTEALLRAPPNDTDVHFFQRCMRGDSRHFLIGLKPPFVKDGSQLATVAGAAKRPGGQAQPNSELPKGGTKPVRRDLS
jgi:hypothetical protein